MTRLDKPGRSPYATALLIFWLGFAVAGCNSLLDVDNPNNVIGDDLLDPTAATSVANGALYSLMSGYSYVLLDHATVSDELIWVGSRDSFQKLEQGWIEDPLNEFTDQGFREWAPARWMCDEAIEILEEHQANGALEDIRDLARTYLYAAFVYTNIPDFFESWAFSDRTYSGKPVPEDQMNTLYDTADEYAANGLALASSGDLRMHLLAMRARAAFAKGVWNQIGHGTVTTGLMSPGDAETAAGYAEAALAIDGSDWRFDLVYQPAGAFGDAQYSINERLELRFSDEYIVTDASGKKRDRTAPGNGVALLDPIDNIPDPRVDEFLTPFEDNTQYSGLTLLSARAMYLIVAEHELLEGNTAAFENAINTVRGFSATPLTDFVSGGAGMPTDQEILIHERRTNLIFQGYRLNDMYRFDIKSPQWQTASTAYQQPGAQFPITKAEIDANCWINPDWPADVECVEPGGDTGG